MRNRFSPNVVVQVHTSLYGATLALALFSLSLLPYLAAGTRILCPVFPSRLLAADLLSHLRFYSFWSERNSPAEQVGRNNVSKSPRRHLATHASPVLRLLCVDTIERLDGCWNPSVAEGGAALVLIKDRVSAGV